MGGRSCYLLLFFFLDEEDKGCFLGIGCAVAAFLTLKDSFLDLDFCLGEHLIWGVLDGFLAAFLCQRMTILYLLWGKGKKKAEIGNLANNEKFNWFCKY